MQKIFNVEQIRWADEYTIENEPISSVDLMERAANECYLWLKQKAKPQQSFAIFAGPGNNGGDGLVIARLLAKAGFKTEVYILNLSDRFSDDFTVNKTRLLHLPEVKLVEWKEKPDVWPEFSKDSLLIDALFGSGLNKELKAFPASVVRFLNEQQNIKVAIDIPSGLFADKAIESKNPIIFHADYTLSFQFPKLAFLLPENEFYVGEWHILNIGLSEVFIEKTASDHFFVNHELMRNIHQPRSKFAHKGTYGHLLMIAGDETKMGAALLSSKAALKSGVGLLTLHHPKAQAALALGVVPEIMSSPDESAEAFTTVPDLAKFSTVAIGPGLGTRKTTAKALKLLIQEVNTPMVFDADALNILSENKTWLSYLPPHSILTPHLKELERLVGKSAHSFERMKKACDFAKKYQVYVIVKGAYTMIVSPIGNIYFNATGNPGMATGGSGDVLTGIISSLLAQNYPPLEACLLAVYLHGLAGDLAAEKLGFESLISSDIIDHLPLAFKTLY